MGRRWFGCFSLLVLGISGCWWDDLTSGSKNVVSNRSNVPPIEVLQKAPNDVGSRVDSLGKQILAANQDIGRTLVTADPQLQKAAAAKQDFRPVFFAYGVPDVVLFHQGFSAIVISDGLVRQCKSDSELAAVLSSELAAMVAEAQAQISARRQEIPVGKTSISPFWRSKQCTNNAIPDRTARDRLYWMPTCWPSLT